MVKLHSRYNPHFEAERYIDALKLEPDYECFVLIEPGMGFLVPALKIRFKNSKIIALHASLDFNVTSTHSIPSWRPDSALTAQDFLEKEIPGAEASKVRIIEWRPGLGVYGDAYLKLVSQTVDFLKRSDAGRRTTAAFGRRWVKNFFKNVSRLEKALLYRTSDIPVIIVGAGPGLEAALPKIAELRERAFVIAAASSLLALEKGGITADLVICTDGGGWALSHMYSCFRGENNFQKGFSPNGAASGAAAGIAASLFAALPSQASKMPFLVLNEGRLWQNIVLKELVIPSVAIPQMGTVAACAVELALILTRGNIYLAGLDLSLKDIKTHARPYSFDNFFYGGASRFSPVYGQSFSRALALRSGGSFDIYAAWFKNRLSHWPARIFSLGAANHSMFKNAAVLPLPSARLPKRNEAKKSVLKEMQVKKAPHLGVGALLRSFNDARLATSLEEELAPLLFPDEKKVGSGSLKKAVEELAYSLPFYGKKDG